jgi:(1->4)-alpha-D-glucan 1-alpha-D-glucosylmutase
MSARAIWERADEGLPKMWVTHSALQVRQRHREEFDASSCYTAVHARGPLAGHVLAFRRGDTIMTIVPRLVTRANGRWQGTRICVPQGAWTNVLTGQPAEGGDIELSELWRDFPVALLERSGSRGHDEHR